MNIQLTDGQATVKRNLQVSQSKVPLPKAMLLSEVFPPQHGGSGKWFWEVYSRLPDKSCLMAVGNSHGNSERDETYPQAIERMDLRMDYRGVTNRNSLQRYFQQIQSIRRLVTRHNIQVIHAARPLSEGLVALAASRLSRIPYVCYVHGEDVNVATTSRELKVVTRAVLRCAKRLISNSDFTRQLLIRDWNIPESKITLMHPGVDVSRFEPPEVTFENREPETLNLLTVGRLQKRKGQDTVIRAIPELLGSFPKLSYTVVGGGSERGQLEDLAIQLGVRDRVRFVGETTDQELVRLYRDCDIFILANRTIGKDVEGFGIVLLEAQAAGKPVIAGASGGTRETMIPGTTGCCINCDTPTELIDTIRQQLADPKRRLAMGQRGRQHVTETFDFQRLAETARACFRELA